MFPAAGRGDVPEAQLPGVVGAPGEHAPVLRQRHRVLVAELDVGTEGWYRYTSDFPRNLGKS